MELNRYFNIRKDEKVLLQKMYLNRFTLSFKNENEIIFQQKYFQDNIFQFRIAFLLVTAIYGLFGFLDSKINQDLVHIFHFLRYYIIVPSMSTVIIFSFTKFFKKYWHEIIFAGILIAGLSGVILTLLAADNYAYYAGLMVIYSATYFFVKLRFYLATIVCWLILIFFNICALTFIKIDSEMLLINDFFFISTNIIGMFAAYNIEYYIRRNFILNKQLDIRNAEIIEVNKSLEIKVIERTKELIKAKEKAEESDRLKSAFLANMSHEIRTPMNGILGFAELLKEPSLSGEEQQKYIKIIQKSGDRMLNIINDIICISKIESGLMELNLSETNIKDQTDYIYTFFKPETDQKGIQFILKDNLPDKTITFKTDKEKVYAILSNLVKNAIKFTDNGSIEFGYSNKDNYLEFYVKDTGVGIPIERQEAIFERFIQADIEDKRAFQGAGLGLSISKAYAEMLNGKIWVESQAGKGSTFYFTLPYSKIDEIKANNNNNNTIESNINLKNLKILIVEDDEVSEMIISLMINNYCKEILIARNGIEAIDTFKNNLDIDLILMDMKMPIMSGYEATSKIRELNKDVVIIAQTAFTLLGDKEKAIEAGCNDYISKPINNVKLKEIMQKHFKQN